MTLALVTSIYGEYDQLVDPPEQEGVDDYVAVVDRHHDGCRLWRQVIEPRPGMHPRMAAKVAKCLPFEYSWCHDTLWIDGHASLIHEHAARWFADHLADGPIAQFRHPERDDYYAEAQVSADLKKYRDSPVLAQAEHYRTRGMAEHFGLWACGVIARRLETGQMRRFGERWLAEQVRWSYQDQVSEPFVLWATMVRPVEFKSDLWHSEHVRFGSHASDL